MIKFLYLHVKNFMSYIEAKVDFSKFNSALVIGKFKNDIDISNGTGKTTLFKSIEWLLFNEYPSDKIAGIIRDGQDKCEGYLILEINGTTYKITRKYSSKSKRSEVKLEKKSNDEWIAEDSKTDTATNVYIINKLGINYESWKHSVIFNQRSINGLSDATPSQRKALLKEPLKLMVYNKFEKVAKSKLNALDTSLNTKESSIFNLGHPDEDVIALEKILSELQLSIKNKEREIFATQSAIDSKKKSLSDLERLKNSDIVAVSKELSDVTIKKSGLVKSIASLKTSLQSQESSMKDHTDDVSSRLQNIVTLTSKLDALKASQHKSEEEVRAQIDVYSQQEIRGQKFVAGLEIQYSKLSKPLPEGSECDECFNELTEEYRDKIYLENKKKSEEIKAKLDASIAKLQRCSNAKAASQAELTQIYKVDTEISSLENKIVAEKSQIQKSQQFILKFKEMVESNQKDLRNKEAEHQQLTDREKELKELSKSLDIEATTKKIVKIGSELDTLNAKHKSLITEFANVSAGVGVTEEKIRNRSKDIETKNNLILEKASLQDQIKLHKSLVFAFSANGIPSLVINSILDDLQIESNKLLSEMRPELQLQFVVEKEDKDTLDVMFKVKNNVREYNLLSGGQKVFFAFALQLALSNVIQKRLGVDVRLLLLDEVDQPFDVAGQKSFVEVIKYLQQTYSVLVITHNDRLKTYFNNVITVEQDIEGSIVSMGESG